MKKEGALVRLIIFLFVIGFLGTLAYALQVYYGIFNAPISYFKQTLSEANQIFFKELITGVSIGAVVFIAILLIIPIFSSKIDTTGYFITVRDGIISSFIFFVSQTVYSLLEKINPFYLLLFVLLVVIIAVVLINTMARIYHEKERTKARASILGSITAGLVFSVLLNLTQIGLKFLNENFFSKIAQKISIGQ